MYQRAGWTIAFTAVFFLVNYKEYPAPAFTVSALLVLLAGAFVAAGYGLHWVATTGQQMVRDQILDAAGITGSERVLCFNQDLAMDAAKRMRSGRVIAVGETASNEAARDSAKTLGLHDKVRFEAGDPLKLTYPDSNFDTVLSSRSLEGLSGSDSARVVNEMARVLKPGGRCIVHDVGDWNHCISVLQLASFQAVTANQTSLPLGLGGRIISSQKAGK